MISEFNFKEPEKLPIESFRDFNNILQQDLKFKFLPFRAYYRYRAYKYAKNVTPELNIIKNILQKDKVSLDVGANLGLFTYFLSRASKKVYAFEPNPYPLRSLKSVIDKNVEIIPIALGNADENIMLRIPKSKKGWTSNGASVANINLNLGKEFSVTMRKIDSLNIENIGLIKIDVEGFEMDVLRGAEKTIRIQKPTLIIENEIVHTADPFEVFDFMKKIGYQIFYVDKKLNLTKLNNEFEFAKNQANPHNKNYDYIQNFIFIYEE